MKDVATSESAQLVERCNKQTILLGTTQIFEQHILRIEKSIEEFDVEELSKIDGVIL